MDDKKPTTKELEDNHDFLNYIERENYRHLKKMKSSERFSVGLFFGLFFGIIGNLTVYLIGETLLIYAPYEIKTLLLLCLLLLISILILLLKQKWGPYSIRRKNLEKIDKEVSNDRFLLTQNQFILDKKYLFEKYIKWAGYLDNGLYEK